MPPARRRRQAASLIELFFAMAILAVLTLISVLCMRQVSKVWHKTSGRDAAMRELMRADAVLQRDLVNSCSGPAQFLTAPVQAGSGTVTTGDALALILADPNQEGLQLTSSGVAVTNLLATYYLAVSTNVAADTGLSPTFAPDASGYEDQCAYKWLIRRETAAPAPIAPGQPPAVPANWFGPTVIEIPSAAWQEPGRRVVARNLLQFRVLHGPPLWELSLTAVAVEDARRKLALGSVPLSQTPYALTHRISVLARN